MDQSLPTAILALRCPGGLDLAELGLRFAANVEILTPFHYACYCKQNHPRIFVGTCGDAEVDHGLSHVGKAVVWGRPLCAKFGSQISRKRVQLPLSTVPRERDV